MKKFIDFSKYSTIRIGPTVEVTLLTKNNLSLPKESFLLGGCSNTLISHTPPSLAMLSKDFDFIKLQDNLLTIGAATPNGKVISFCKKNNIANFEFLSHLPGKIGGAVKMNAGLKEYEIFNHLYSIHTPTKEILKKEISFGYRYTKIDDIILAATFEISFGFSYEKVTMFANMRKNQPKEASAGSCFKNPPNEYAGKLLEAVGLKGFRIGDMGFSNKHANFLINYNKGTYQDALLCIQEAKQRVQNSYGIDLELEVILVQKDNHDI